MTEDKDSPPKDQHNGRYACTECQRRKQKCNREWPCNHCQKRKVADQCRFKDVKSPPGQDLRRKRERDSDLNFDGYDYDGGNDIGDCEGFEALGYAAGHFLDQLKSPAEKERRPPKQYLADVNSCPQLQRALQALPPRPYTDSLVQNFLTNVNYHYYIIYPNSFLHEYQAWWADRAEGSRLGLQWTCLLLMICACSTQYISVELQRKLELDLGESTQKLTEQYHSVARELHSVIPVGHNHLLNVQQLFHSCYWYKSEARFVECWHVLSSAIREAQELGIHQESIVGEIPDFERELHRRVWCVLDTWDWQISALLSRPMIIDRTDCDVGLPSLTLEGYSPSPLLHMKMQSELIRRLSKRFGLPKNVVEPDDVQEYKTMLEEWMASFPPTYNFTDPDTSKDTTLPWIVLHRHYLYTMGCSMTLDPIRAYLSKPMNSKTSSEKELQIRRDGIKYALKLMGVLHGFFDHVWPRDAKFHFVIFCIFDTAAVYSSAILHDEDNSVPQRDEMLHSLESALEMVKRLMTALPAAQLYYDILTRLKRKVHRKLSGGEDPGGPRKRAKVKPVSLSPPAAGQPSAAPASSTEPTPQEGQSVRSMSSANEPVVEPQAQIVYPGVPDELAPQFDYGFQPAPFLSEAYPTNGTALYNPPPPPIGGPYAVDGTPVSNGQLVPQWEEQIPGMGLSTMSEQDLGALAELWRWQSLDLDLIHQRPPAG